MLLLWDLPYLAPFFLVAWVPGASQLSPSKLQGIGIWGRRPALHLAGLVCRLSPANSTLQSKVLLLSLSVFLIQRLPQLTLLFLALLLSLFLLLTSPLHLLPQIPWSSLSSQLLSKTGRTVSVFIQTSRCRPRTQLFIVWPRAIYWILLIL